MLEQMLDGIRKASESSVFAQQEAMKWFQQWPSAPATTVQGTIDRGRTVQKRWVQVTTDALTRQRELLDSACSAGIELVEQTAQLSDAKSPDDYRRAVEQLWRKLFELIKAQSEAQFQQAMKASHTWLETAQGR
jgi:hypothetical protein